MSSCQQLVCACSLMLRQIERICFCQPSQLVVGLIAQRSRLVCYMTGHPQVASIGGPFQALDLEPCTLHFVTTSRACKAGCVNCSLGHLQSVAALTNFSSSGHRQAWITSSSCSSSTSTAVRHRPCSSGPGRFCGSASWAAVATASGAVDSPADRLASMQHLRALAISGMLTESAPLPTGTLKRSRAPDRFRASASCSCQGKTACGTLLLLACPALLPLEADLVRPHADGWWRVDDLYR